MLKTAKIFKSFTLDIRQSDAAVRLSAFSPYDIRYKSDNNVTSVRIRIDGNINPFEYKYFTADEETLFEITGIVKNNDLYIFNLKYLTHCPLNVYTTEFLATKTTPKKFKNLALTITDLISIIGKENITINRKSSSSTQVWFFLKIEFTEFPQNDFYAYNRPNGTFIKQQFGAQLKGLLGNLTARISAPNEETALSLRNLTANTDKTVFYIPIPATFSNGTMSNAGSLNIISSAYSKSFPLYLASFTDIVSQLVSDLTFAMSVVPVTPNKSSVYLTTILNNVANFTPITCTNSVFFIRNPSITGDTYLFYKSLLFMKPTQTAVSPETDSYYPVLTNLFALENREPSAGFFDLNTYIPIDITYQGQEFPLCCEFLGNVISLENYKRIYIQNLDKIIRFYRDYDANDYIDIPSTFEYTKSAFSNYEAYTKSNIELLNRQNLEQLKLSQEFDKKNFRLNQVNTGVGAIANSITRAGIAGSLAGAATAAQGIGELLTNDISYQYKVEMENRKNELSALQAREEAQSLIVPGTIINGTVSLEKIYHRLYPATGNEFISAIAFYTFIPSTTAEVFLYRYVIKNKIVQPVESFFNNVITYPEYFPAGKEIQVYFDAVDTQSNISFYAYINTTGA